MKENQDTEEEGVVQVLAGKIVSFTIDSANDESKPNPVSTRALVGDDGFTTGSFQEAAKGLTR